MNGLCAQSLRYSIARIFPDMSRRIVSSTSPRVVSAHPPAPHHRGRNGEPNFPGGGRVAHSRARSARPAKVRRMNAHEASELVGVERRLMEQYGDRVGPDEVMRCFDDATAAFADVRVRAYVALMIERLAAKQLRAVAARIECNRMPT